MKKQFVFQQFGSPNLTGLQQMAAKPLISFGASIVILGLFIFVFREILVLFLASILIFLGLFLMLLGIKAWFYSPKVEVEKKRTFGETEIIE